MQHDHHYYACAVNKDVINDFLVLHRWKNIVYTLSLHYNQESYKMINLACPVTIDDVAQVAVKRRLSLSMIYGLYGRS